MDKIGDILNQDGIISRKPVLRLIKSEEADIIPVEQMPVVLPSRIKSAPGSCSLCSGAGYVRANVEYGHPNFGKALLCECRVAAKKRQRQEELLLDSGIMLFGMFEEASFKTFKRTLSGVATAYDAALQFADNPTGWLVLVGPCGSGKTHLAVSITRQCIEMGNMVMIRTVPDLLRTLRAGYDNHEYDARFEEMCQIDILILDDYGTQNDTGWVNEQLFQLLNYRYNHKLATVITANPEGLLASDHRLHSRMSDRRLARVIDMSLASDYRVSGDTEEE